jgi:serine/threonine protein kinase
LFNKRRTTIRKPEEVKFRNIEEEKATIKHRATKRARESSLEGKTRINVDSFEFIGMIGEGSYGSVYMAKKKSTGKYYAIKVI